MTLQDSGPGALGNIGEGPVPVVVVKNGAIFVVDVDLETLDLRKRVAVHQQQILPAVIVEIKKSAAPSHKTRVVRDAGGQSNIIEFRPAPVAIQRLALVGEVAAENVRSPVAVVITRSHAHARHSLAVFVESCAAQDSLLAKGSVAAVDVEQ